MTEALEETRNLSRSEEQLSQWIEFAEFICLKLHRDGCNYIDVFESLLRMTWGGNWRGASHETSAALFIVLSELGAQADLVIGEVRSQYGTFDHSWVEVGGRIIDVAISLPAEGGLHVSGPLYMSVDLDKGEETKLLFGRLLFGLGLHAAAIRDATLEEYASLAGLDDFWGLVRRLGSSVGVHLDEAQLKSKYGQTHRTYRAGHPRRA